jgi:hypothetical protein
MHVSGNKLPGYLPQLLPGIARSCLCALLLCLNANAQAAEPAAEHRVQDLYYGQALYQYFQQDELTAITSLMTAATRPPRAGSQLDESNLLLADLYYGRPGLLGTLKVSRDVLGTAAMAGALEYVSDNVTSALSEVTGSWSARILGPLGQGLVNGVVTLRIGAAARMRCRSTGGTRPRWRIWRPRDYFLALRSLQSMVQERFRTLDVEPVEKPGWFRSIFRRVAGSEQSGATGDQRTGSAAAWESGYDPLLDSDILKEK